MIKFLSILFLLVALAVNAATPSYLVSLKPDGVTPETNAVILTPWPPNAPFYVYGTNVIAGLGPMTNVPNSGGFFSNSFAPIIFTVRYASAPSVGYYVRIADTTNYASLATYATNVPVALAGYGSMFGLVTNWLGYWPATNSFAGIAAALGYYPANTNDANVQALIMRLSTNANAQTLIQNLSTNAGAVTLIQALSTNANAQTLIQNLSTNAGAVTLIQALSTNANARTLIQNLSTNANAQTLMMALSTNAAAVTLIQGLSTNAGAVTLMNAIAANKTNTLAAPALLGLVPNASLTTNVVTRGGSGQWSAITNGCVVWISFKTNELIGPLFTNYPQGSLLLATNGGRFTLSNDAWIAF